MQRELEKLCQCQVTTNSIDRESFLCFDQSEMSVSYRAQLSGTSETDGDSLISLLEDWVSSGPTIRVRGVLMKVDATCAVTISDFSDNTCFDEEASSQTDNTGTVVGGAVVAVLIVAVAVALTTIVIVLIVLRRRKRHGEFSVERAEE